MTRKIVVTGGCGYIGSHVARAFKQNGDNVFIIDRVERNHTLKDIDGYYIDDFASDASLATIYDIAPDVVVHCAGTSLVGPSVVNPREYYENNFVKTKRLVDYIIDKRIKTRLVFSSSAATYGEPIMTPCQEIDPAMPISPYGQSKLIIEWMLESYQQAYGLDYVAFRYFNACGADPKARHGQEPGATHIIARILDSIQNKQDFTLHGTDYATPDGTCIRDYIHVEDLAEAHILATDQKIPGGIYNLGTNVGYSNIEVVRAAAQITGVDIPVLYGPKRDGDPAILTADAGKFMQASNWQPKFVMTDIINHVWAWYNR